MSDQIDTRITASLHPGNVRALADFSEADASFVGQVETAFSTAFEGLRQVHDAREAARENPTWNEAQQIIATDDLARKTLDRATRAFDSAKANLDKTISSYEAQLTQPVEAKAALSVCAEIRAHVKGLTVPERLKFVQDAIANGDHTSASAVLGAPSYLSGLEGETAAAFTRHYHETGSPEVARRVRLMKAARGLITDKGGLIFKETEKAVGMRPDRVAALRRAKDDAERAFILKDA